VNIHLYGLETNMKRTTIFLTTAQVKRLAQAAKDGEVAMSASQFIRIAINEALARQQRAVKLAAR
jgi:hypothetical protein